MNSHVAERHLGVDSNFRTPSKRLRAMCSQHREHYECRAEHINRHSGVMESRYKPDVCSSAPLMAPIPWKSHQRSEMMIPSLAKYNTKGLRCLPYSAFPGLPVIWWLIYVIHKTITHANARSNCRIYMIQKMRSAKSRLEHRAFSDSDSVSPAF